MGVLDLLRRRSRSEVSDAAGSPPPRMPEAAADSVQMRGDFMLLPPLRPTFGAPVRLQQGLDDFLVTHREVAVTNEPLAHEIDPQRLGMVSGRARRSPRPRPAYDPLVHRHDAIEPEIEEYAEQLPAPAPPRRLPATARPVVTAAARAENRDPMVGELPSVTEVHRSVSAPSIRMSAPDLSSEGSDLGAVRDAARMDTATDAPVVRRRGGASAVESTPLPVPAPDEITDIDLDSLAAPSAADMPPLTGGTRVRGAMPPESSAGTRPLVGIDRSPDASPIPAAPATSAETAAPLEHRSADRPETSVSDQVVTSLDASATTADPDRVEPGAAIPASRTETRQTRSLLTARAPLGGARNAAPSSAEAKPSSSGRTGVQRKARTSSAPAASARALRVPAPGTQPEPTRGGIAPTPAPAASDDAAAGTPAAVESAPTAGSVEGPRMIEVPPEVRRAVAAAAGSAPDSVLVHQSDQVHAEADSLNAEAFTRDGEIHLARDADLDTPRGQALLAHELTHVVQQRGGSEQMPDEGSRAGQQHEELAQKVERAVAQAPQALAPTPLEHAGGGEAEGAAPANVPQGIQRRGREVGAFGSINRDSDSDDNDDDALIGAPPQPEPAIAHASAQQPSVLEQVALVHAGQAPPVREESEPGPGFGARAKSTFERMMLAPAAPKAKPKPHHSGSSSAGIAPITRTEAGADSGGSEPGTTGEQPRPEPGAKEKSLDYFSRMMLAPAPPKPDDEPDERRANLERQADSLYPYLRSRLRAELVRDRERRGRLARDWR